MTHVHEIIEYEQKLDLCISLCSCTLFLK